MTRLVRDVPAVALSPVVDRGDGGRRRAGRAPRRRRADRLAPHVHAPLQSGRIALLRRMGRHWYTSATLRARRRAACAASMQRSRTRRRRHRRVSRARPRTITRRRCARRAAAVHLPARLSVLAAAGHGRRATRRHRWRPSIAQRRAAELRAIGGAKGRGVSRPSRVGGARGRRRDRRPAGEREGLTGDYLTGSPGRSVVPARTRFAARLAR